MPERLPLVLASTSPRRRELIAELGVEWIAAAPPDREWLPHQLPDHTPIELAAANALQKARDVAPSYPDHWCLGADTIVVIDGDVLNKPGDLQEAAVMLTRLAGRSHQVITATALHRSSPEPHEMETQTISTVHFHELSSSQIADYLRQVHVLDKAGAYAAQEKADLIIKKIEGSYSNVVGLPLEDLAGLLTALDPPLKSKSQI